MTTAVADPPNFVAFPLLKKANTRGQLKRVNNAEQEEEQAKATALKTLRTKKAWDVALGPAKTVPMQAFMMWMSGSSIQIFSGMAVIMLVKNSIGAAATVNKTFKQFEAPSSTTAKTDFSSDNSTPQGDEFLLQKAAFVGCNLLLLAVAVYKVKTMGLLPTFESDWLHFQDMRIPQEISTVSLQ